MHCAEEISLYFVWTIEISIELKWFCYLWRFHLRYYHIPHRLVPGRAHHSYGMLLLYQYFISLISNKTLSNTVKRNISNTLFNTSFSELSLNKFQQVSFKEWISILLTFFVISIETLMKMMCVVFGILQGCTVHCLLVIYKTAV